MSSLEFYLNVLLPVSQEDWVGSKSLTTAKEKARAFCKHYAKISNFRPRHRIKNGELIPLALSEFYSLFNDDFSELELDVGLNGLAKGKSPGPDGILPEFLIYLGLLRRNTLLRLINFTWKSGLEESRGDSNIEA
ncbi:hypothetical protein CDAR_531321 [Caerostris darwini]|uniref:Uncharacterized protein n=1 Tax=Caerostris darwini TaxID=1538125 RepID=A0AAV4QZL0_9ARAC|nr:hypothetical protein CDAR_531321 [Caerostris darwini]